MPGDVFEKRDERMIIKTKSGINFLFVDVTKAEGSALKGKRISDRWRCIDVYFDCAGCPRVPFASFDMRFRTKAAMLSFFKKIGIVETIGE